MGHAASLGMRWPRIPSWRALGSLSLVRAEPQCGRRMRFSLREFSRALGSVPWRRTVSALRPDPVRWLCARARSAAIGAAILGAQAVHAQSTSDLVSVTHAQAVLPPGHSCQMPPPADTIAALLFASLRGTRPRGMQDTAWLHYQRTVLDAVRRTFVLPHEIQLAAFSSPFPLPESPAPPDAAAAPPSPDDDSLVATATRVGSDSTKAIRGHQHGVLLDQDDGQPVPSASVSLAEAGETRLTDSSGAWHISGIAPGRYRLRVRRIGYTAKDTVVVVGAEAPTTSDTIRISRAPVRLSRVTVEGERPSAYVTLMMSTVVTVTLDAEGSLKDVHVAASSGSAPVDTIVIASLRRTAAATDFPTVPMGTRQKSVTFDLVISMNEPPLAEETVVVGRVEAPVWALQVEHYWMTTRRSRTYCLRRTYERVSETL